jgi:hypothetical protein
VYERERNRQTDYCVGYGAYFSQNIPKCLGISFCNVICHFKVCLVPQLGATAVEITKRSNAIILSFILSLFPFQLKLFYTEKLFPPQSISKKEIL